MAQAPHIHRTRYAKCGDMDIAYQVLGDGPTDLLVLPGPFVPIDSIDDEPSLYRFHRRLASFSRVIRLDHRGVGLSSRLAAITTLGPKFWAQDAIAVMDAVGCEQATIFAPSFHAMNGLVLAADYPERVRSLIVVNGSARPLWAPDYPVGAQVRRADPFLTVALEPDAVERGFDVLSIVAPTVAGDDVFRAWWDLAGNRAGPPSIARAVSKGHSRGRRTRCLGTHRGSNTDLAPCRIDVHPGGTWSLPRRAHRWIPLGRTTRHRYPVLGWRHRADAR